MEVGYPFWILVATIAVEDVREEEIFNEPVIPKLLVTWADDDINLAPKFLIAAADNDPDISEASCTDDETSPSILNKLASICSDEEIIPDGILSNSL